MRTALKILLSLVLLFILVVALGALSLALPGTPTSGARLHFQGYIPLPKGKTLSGLDYLTVAGPYLFVANSSNGAVNRIDISSPALPTEAQILTLPGKPATHGVALDPVSHLAFVSHSGSNSVDVFDPASMHLLKSIPIADDDSDAIFYLPSLKLIYVGNGDAHLATLIDPATQSVVGKIALGGKPEFAVFDPETSLLYQNLEDKDTVLAIDPATRTIAATYHLDTCKAPSAMAFDPTHRLLFLGCSGNASLAVFSLASHTVIASAPIGAHVDSIVYDEPDHLVFSTGITGKVVVLDQQSPTQYHLADSIKTHFGAHTLAFDPHTRRLFVAYAALFARPRIAVFNLTP